VLYICCQKNCLKLVFILKTVIKLSGKASLWVCLCDSITYLTFDIRPMDHNSDFAVTTKNRFQILQGREKLFHNYLLRKLQCQ
jgi:hypothetical protein